MTAAVVADTTKRSLHTFVRRNVAPGSILYTDEHRGYQGLERLGYNHLSVRHSIGEYVATKRTRTAWSRSGHC